LLHRTNKARFDYFQINNEKCQRVQKYHRSVKSLRTYATVGGKRQTTNAKKSSLTFYCASAYEQEPRIPQQFHDNLHAFTKSNIQQQLIKLLPKATPITIERIEMDCQELSLKCNTLITGRSISRVLYSSEANEAFGCLRLGFFLSAL